MSLKLAGIYWVDKIDRFRSDMLATVITCIKQPIKYETDHHFCNDQTHQIASYLTC